MITYPVDVENTKWTTVRISTGEILKHGKKYPRLDGEEIPDLDPDIAVLLEVTAPYPVYDPATQVLVSTPPVVDIPNNTHTHGWAIEARPQEDIDLEEERERAKTEYTALKAHSGSNNERLTRVENVAAYLLKEFLGDELT